MIAATLHAHTPFFYGTFSYILSRESSPADLASIKRYVSPRSQKNNPSGPGMTRCMQDHDSEPSLNLVWGYYV